MIELKNTLKMEYNQNKKFTCQIFYFILAYVRMGFYLCMIPFTATVDKNRNLQFKHYRIHQVICFTLHISSFYFGVTTLWNLTKLTTIGNVAVSSSTTMYQFALFALLNTGVITFIVTCWFVRSNPYKCLLIHTWNHADTDFPNKHQRYSMALVVLMTFIQIMFTASTEISALIHNPNLQLFSAISYLKHFISVFLMAYFQLLFQIAVIMPFDLSTFCMYLIGQSFKQFASIEYAILSSPNTTWHYHSLGRLTDYYLTTKSLTKSLNKAFGTNITILVLSSMPTVGYGLSCMLSNTPTSVPEDIRTIYILFAFYIFLLLGAKGQDNVQNFAKSAFEQMWKNGGLKIKNDVINDDNTRSLLLTVMQYVNSSSVGVGGTPFLIVTYKFVGTMTSALITYTIILFQFQIRQ